MRAGRFVLTMCLVLQSCGSRSYRLRGHGITEVLVPPAAPAGGRIVLAKARRPPANPAPGCDIQTGVFELRWRGDKAEVRLRPDAYFAAPEESPGREIAPRVYLNSMRNIETFRAALKAEPHRYIAQPTLALSTVPTLTDRGFAPRHVDFRPFVLTGADGVTIVPGGLTRVALREGSLVVNSSQGGGTKDSLILVHEDEQHALPYGR